MFYISKFWISRTFILYNCLPFRNLVSSSSLFFSWLLFCSSATKSCPTLCHPMDCSQAYLSFTVSWSLLKLMSIELVMPSNHLILCHPLLLPSAFPSIRVFSSESALHIGWPKYQSFRLSVGPSMNIQGWFPLGWTGWICLVSRGLSRVFSNNTIWKHPFFCAQSSLWSSSHTCTWLMEKP